MDLTDSDVRAVVGDIVASTLGLRMPGDTEARSRVDEDLGADSIDLLESAARVAGFFRLHETGLDDDLLRRRTIGDWTQTVLRSWQRSEERRLTFLTSGTTGEPKGCTHDWNSLVQEIREFAGLFSRVERIVGTVPRHHIYGFLWTVLLPRHLGVPFSDARHMLPGGLMRSLRRGDLLVSLPLRYEHLRTAGLAFPAGVEGVTSTGPCPPGLIGALRALSLERMVEVYGSSETGGVGWREDPDAPYRLLPHWSLSGDGNRLTRTHPDGRLDKTVGAPDLLLARPGGFVPAGRRDHAVQVGGVNVYPARIAGTIRDHPDVADCAVRLMRPEEGRRLKAFVVLRGDDRNTSIEAREALDRWLRATFDAPERPASLTFGPSIPRDDQGKARDWS